MGEERLELNPEDKEWLKARWNFTDEQIESLTDKQKHRYLAQRDPRVAQMVSKGKLIAEVAEARNCPLDGHKRGDKYIFTASGLLIPEESPPRPCLWAMGPIVPFTYAFWEYMLRGKEPKLMWDVVKCLDVGLKCGGSGEVLFKIYYEGPDGEPAP